MSRSPEEKAVTEEFESYYRIGAADIMRRIEGSVCGCDYGSTSWTTRAEAEAMARELPLRPGARLLDLGAGAGWPSLHIAALTGCTAVMVDLPFNGLAIASARARSDRRTGASVAVLADAATLPFADSVFDAISHSDVLCCLLAKADVLRSCRRVIRESGAMAFTAIELSRNASAHDRAGLDGAGPPFPAAETPYPDMLAQSGWRLVDQQDWSSAYCDTISRLIEALEANADAVCAHLGRTVFHDRLATQRRALAAANQGILARRYYVAVPAGRE